MLNMHADLFRLINRNVNLHKTVKNIVTNELIKSLKGMRILKISQPQHKSHFRIDYFVRLFVLNKVPISLELFVYLLIKQYISFQILHVHVEMFFFLMFFLKIGISSTVNL